MKTLIVFLICLPLISFGQKDDLWYAFYDKEAQHKGFKDADGQVMIEPKLGFLGLFHVAKKFDKIMVVREKLSNGKTDNYYLLKNGKKFGRGSIYIKELQYDCESEGHIKFQNFKKNLVGLYNSKGKTAVSAEYSWLSQVKNGMFVGVKGATKKPLTEHNHEGCEHWIWDGGTTYLVDTTNTILVENFEFKTEIDLYSLKISKKEIQEPSRVNFKGTNGLYYSFIDNKLLFEEYLDDLLDNLTLENLIEASFEKIIFYKDGWNALPKEQYIKENFEAVSNKLKILKEENVEKYIFIESDLHVSDQFIEMLKDKRDNCDKLNISKYPVINLRISKKGTPNQKSLTFIKLGRNFELIIP